jgi:hypothetical protein
MTILTLIAIALCAIAFFLARFLIRLRAEERARREMTIADAEDALRIHLFDATDIRKVVFGDHFHLSFVWKSTPLVLTKHLFVFETGSGRRGPWVSETGISREAKRILNSCLSVGRSDQNHSEPSSLS